MLEKEPLDFQVLWWNPTSQSLFFDPSSILVFLFSFFFFLTIQENKKGGPNSRPKKERRLYRGDSILHLRSHSSPEPYFFLLRSFLFPVGPAPFFSFPVCFLFNIFWSFMYQKRLYGHQSQKLRPSLLSFLSLSLSLFFQDMLHLWFSFSSSLAPSSSSPTPGI